MASGGPGGSASVMEKLLDMSKEVEVDVMDNEQGRDTRSDKIGDSTNTAEEGVDKGGKSNQDSTTRKTPMDLDQTTRHQITQKENDENDSGETDQDVGSKSNGDGGDEKQNSDDSQHDAETKMYKELKEEQRQEGSEDNITSKQSRFVGSNKKQNDNEDKVLGQSGSMNDPNSDGKEQDENQPETIDADQEGTNNTGDIPDENGVQYKGNGAHGHNRRSKSQEGKMVTSLNEDRRVQETSSGTLSVTVSQTSERDHGKESQQDVENWKTTYQVQLSFENKDLLLEIPCLQKEYYQWTFIVEKKHAEFVNSLGFTGFKRIKKDYQDKYLTLVCENNADPEDLEEKIKSLFKEYSNKINAVYQVDIPDPQKVCEVAAKKIENCKKGNVKVYPWEMNGLWIVGYGQHPYAVTKEIHDIIKNRSTKGSDTTEPSSKIDSSSCRTQETKRDKTQPQLNKPLNDRIEDMIDRVENEAIKHFGIISNILKKYPGLNITVVHNKIVFEGLSANVNPAYSDFKEELTAIKESETNVSLSARCANMLHSKEVVSFLQHEIKPIHLLISITDDQWVIYGQTKKDAKSVVKCLSDLVLQKEIQIDPIYWKSEEMVSEIHKLERLYGEKLKLCGDNDDKKRNYIVATKDIMPEVSTALEEKKKCLTKKCVKHVDSSDHSSHNFLEKQMSHKLSDLRSRYNVNICSVSRNKKIGWKVEGSDLNVRLSIEQLEILKKSIKKESVKFEPGKAVRFLESKPGSDFLKTVEDALHCLIETESESYEEAIYGAATSKIECKEYRHWIYKKTNRMIRLVCGNGESCGTELLVDVVSGSNKPGKGITYKPGQSKSAKVELPVPFWIDGNRKERDNFCTLLNKLFDSMVERGCKTVAFPFDINYKVGWKNANFVKFVIFEWNKFLSQKELVLHCTFFHPEPDRCIIAESAIDEMLKKDIDSGSVLRSGSSEVNSLTSTKLNNGAGEEYMYPIRVVLGELAVQQVDIIVNTTSKDLSLDTGHVSASILRMGGQTIQDECDRYKKRNFHGIPYGDFVETNGCGHLKCKKVYHCALSAYKTNGIPNLKKIIERCLEKADKSNMASISFPAFGTGNLGFPGEISAECMFKFAEGFFDAKGTTNTSVKDVRFVIYHKDQSTIQAFQREEEKRRNVSNFRMSVASNLTLYVATGEISNYETDALIVFWSGNEVYNNVVPREYLQTIGQSFTDEWNKKRPNIHSQKYIETSAGTLPFKKIFHQVIDDSSESKMSSGILFALKKAESSSMKSVCVALLRTDPLARLTEKYAKAFNGALKSFQSQRSKTSHFRFVRIVINDGNIYNKFRTEVQRETVVKPTSSSKATDKTGDFKKKKTIVHVSVTSDTEEDIKSAFIKIKKKISSIEDTSNEEQKAYPGKAVPNTGHDKADKKHTDGDKKADSRTKEKQLFLPSQVPKQRVQLIKTELERCRLLVYIKDDNTILKDPTTIKMELMQTFKQKKAVLVVYPFEDNRSCLLKFKSPEDAEYCLTSWKNPVSPYEIKPFPPQVIVNIQAEISPNILHKIKQNGCFDKFKVIEQESGAELKNFGSCYLLEGSFVDIEIANEIIGSWINDETNRNDTEYLDVTSGRLKQDYISNVEERNSETLSSNPGTEKIECTLDHFNILEKFELIKDFPSLKTGRASNDKFVEIEGPIDDIKTLKHALDDISNWQYEEISTFAEEDVTKFNEVCKGITQCFPDVHIRHQESKIVIAGKSYENINNAKLKLNLALGREKTTGRGKRVITNPDHNSSTVLSQESELLPDQSASTKTKCSVPVNAEIFETKEGVSVCIYPGDILFLNVDCIVNNQCSYKGEIAAYIATNAGEEMVQQYDRYIKQNGPLSITKICDTTAGNLQYKRILHVASPYLVDYTDEVKCREDLQWVVLNCLVTAAKLKMSSIAIPAISSGMYRVPEEVCASAYLESVTHFISESGLESSLKEIHFVDQNQTILQFIVSAFSSSQNFHTRKLKIPLAIDMPAKITKRNSRAPPVPQQETKTAYPYHVTENKGNRDVYVFHISRSLTVKIYTGDVTKAPTAAIVSTEDKTFSGQIEVAKYLLRNAASGHGHNHKKLQSKMHSELIIEETADAGNFHFVTVYRVVIPTPKQNMNKTDEEIYFNQIFTAVQSVLIRAQSDEIPSIAMDLIGKGKTFGLVSEDHCVSCCTSAVMDFSKQHQESKPLEIFIINLNESITNIFKCAFLDMIEKHHGQSPSLQLKEKKMQSRETSDEDEKYYKQATYPYGTMTIEVNSTPRLKGHEDSKTIILKVFFPDGNYEGKSFRGLSRDFYLPNSPNGKKALKLLQNAFEQNKLFHIGYRKDRSEFGVTYSGIHLKTNIDGGKEKYGYPDQKYLDRLKEELASVGVFEDKVEKSGQMQETSV